MCAHYFFMLISLNSHTINETFVTVLCDLFPVKSVGYAFRYHVEHLLSKISTYNWNL